MMKNNIPADARPIATTHLAEGEATGHYHDAVGKDVSLLMHEGAMYVDAPYGVTMVHQEHKPVPVPPGQRRRGLVREYDHFAEEARAVVD